MKIVLIGAGNVATHLGKALSHAGFDIVQLYSRTEVSASALANRLNTAYTTRAEDIIDDADLYFISIKDDAIPDLLSSMTIGKGLYVHTAGSVGMDIFSKYTKRCGVVYPLQTFSREREISFREIPLFIESAQDCDREILSSVADALSGSVHFISSEQRKHLHLSAVFACNFTNHLYAMAAEIVKEQGLDWSLLLPLIKETAQKVSYMPPVQAQTGPAVRADRQTMSKHLALLKEEDYRTLYRQISEHIGKMAATAKP